MAWTNQSKNILQTSYLKKEDGDYLLQENGDKIVLSYGWQNSSKNSSSWTNGTKN